MKSKLFLSLSLLTVAFSTVQAVSFPSLSLSLCKAAIQSNCTLSNAKLAGALVAPAAVVGAGFYGLEKYLTPEVKPTYMQRAKNMIQTGYNTVKANAVKGYNTSLTFAKAHPYSTAGAVAAVAALGYVAYNSEIFGSAKAQSVQSVVVTPVVSKKRLSGF